MYTSVNEFLADWRQEASLSAKVLETLTDDSLKQAVSATQSRTLGDLGWHLTGGIGAMLGATGVQIDGPDYKAPTPASAAEIADGYRRMSEAAITALQQQWTDAKLTESLKLFGSFDTTYGGVLKMMIRHQCHHRGQMTILMRQAGLVPPGVYGPNEEETAAMIAARA